jgi:hypothetical protein
VPKAEASCLRELSCSEEAFSEPANNGHPRAYCSWSARNLCSATNFAQAATSSGYFEGYPADPGMLRVPTVFSLAMWAPKALLSGTSANHSFCRSTMCCLRCLEDGQASTSRQSRPRPNFSRMTPWCHSLNQSLDKLGNLPRSSSSGPPASPSGPPGGRGRCSRIYRLARTGRPPGRRVLPPRCCIRRTCGSLS